MKLHTNEWLVTVLKTSIFLSGVKNRADGTEPMEFGSENEVLGGFRTSSEAGIVSKTI